MKKKELDMKNIELINKFNKINNLMIESHLQGNFKKKKFYQSLLNWLISKEINKWIKN